MLVARAVGGIGLALLAAVATWAPVFDGLAPREIDREGPAPGAPAPRTLVVVSIDGLAPRVLARSQAPGLARLATEGRAARRATTTLPSVTLTSHTSMLSGVHGDVHGVDWNRYQPWSAIRIPTLFSLCAEQRWRCGLFAGKRKFAHFAEDEPGVEHYTYAPLAREVLAAALDYLRRRQPAFVLVHLAEVDLAGHAHGWGSEAQRDAIARVDALLGPFLSRARAACERPFVAIVTSDHGGHDTRHGSDRPEDLEIPWIAWGDGVAAAPLTEEVSTVDTAATVLSLLGRPVPPGWQGRPRL